ncbi:MAG: TonB-dependent receptor [Sporomusaceae bacterium]|nr:TonB-dependent receptor [Sporomusaceae bacterium]
MIKKYCAHRQLWRQVSLGLLTAAFVSAPQAALAAENAVEEFTLDSIVVTAQRRETRDLNTPAAVTVITAEELKETGAVNVFDALDHTIGFSNTSFGPAGTDYGMSASRINIRGLEKGTLVLVNGAPVNLLNYNNVSGIPLAAVERVEVIRGAASTLYGAEALTGVVNIITKRPGTDNRTQVSLTGGNYSREWSVGTEFEKGSLYVQRQYIGDVSQTSRKNLTGKTGTNIDKPIRAWGLDKGYKNSFYYTTQLNERLDFNWSYSDAESNRPYYNTDGSNYIDYFYSDVRNNINLIYNDTANEFRSTLSYNKRRAFGDKYTYSSSGKTWGIASRYNMYSVNWDNQKTWRLRDDLDTLVAGITAAREHYNGQADSKLVRWVNTRRDSIAVYGAYTYAVTPRFSTTLGVRGHFVDDYLGRENVYLPQLQTLYRIDEHTSWYTNVGKAFQMAAINQYFTTIGRIDPLKPQQGWNYETGLKVINQNQSWKIALFHLDIKDQLVWAEEQDDPSIKYMTNAGDFRNTGVEVEFAQRINDYWKYNLGVTYSNPESNYDTSAKKRVPWTQSSNRIQAIAGVTHNKDKWLTNVNFLYLGDREESYYKINGKISDVPDRIQLNAAIRYQADDNQSIALNLYNILDRDNSVNYYENLDLPFNWTLNYTYSF